MFRGKVYLSSVWRQKRRLGFRTFNATYRALGGIIPWTKLILKNNLPEFAVNFLANTVMPEKKRSPRNRRFIREGLTREAMLQEMERRKIRYVLLRWFEGLPDWPEGEDMDFLIFSEDVDKIQDLFTLRSNDMPVDLFSHDGSKGLSYIGLPYYPLHFSKRLIDEAILTELGARVPSAELYFASLAYHAVYHKFHKSGLPLESGGAIFEKNPENSYPDRLAKMARNLGLNLDCSLLGLHNHLSESQLAPTFDLLRKLVHVNPQLNFLMIDVGATIPLNKGEVIAFVVRQWALDNGLYEGLRREILVNSKLEILTEVHLDEEQRKYASQEIRGGDWGKGPHQVSGGGPAVLLLCFDYHPVEATAELKYVHPHVRNANISGLKTHLRCYVENRVLITKHANPIHSADDEFEAWHYANIIVPDQITSLKEMTSQIRQTYETKLPIIELLHSYRSRAKLEVVDFGGKKAVKKTYRLSALKYFERELEILDVFAENSPLIPKVLSRGSNYFIIPYYENILRGLTQKEQDKILKDRGPEIVNILKLFYDQGYALMDFNRNNLLITPEEDLIIIDFEYAHKYIKRPSKFVSAFDIVGVSQAVDGTFIDGVSEPCLTYEHAWKPVIGPLQNYLK